MRNQLHFLPLFTSIFFTSGIIDSQSFSLNSKSHICLMVFVYVIGTKYKSLISHPSVIANTTSPCFPLRQSSLVTVFCSLNESEPLPMVFSAALIDNHDLSPSLHFGAPFSFAGHAQSALAFHTLQTLISFTSESLYKHLLCLEHPSLQPLPESAFPFYLNKPIFTFHCSLFLLHTGAALLYL